MSQSKYPSGSLLTHFESLEDPRTAYLVEHPLLDIVALTICAVICGAETWEEIEAYGHSKVAWLKTFLSLPNGIPSHDTIARVFALLEPTQLQECFVSWVKSVAELSLGEVISLDGKSARHSYDTGTGKGAIHMVSAWASENQLVLGQVKVTDKSNEITAIPRLLNILDVSGCIVTIDAMGAQTEIAKQIIDQGADYVLSLKGNQGTLREDVEQLFDWACKTDFKGIDHEAYQTIDKGHGRIEVRRYWLLDNVEYLENAERWDGLNRVGMIESERRVDGQPPTIERRYYLTSLDGGVEQFAYASRAHWGIENKLHWSLDVVFHEDDSRIRTGHAPENMTVIRKIALNLLAQESSKGSKKAKRLKAGWDNDFLVQVLLA
ncbi:MAG: ISAs1 family transposase [Cyanobacteria bacterium P01_F01_bin.116]